MPRGSVRKRDYKEGKADAHRKPERVARRFVGGEKVVIERDGTGRCMSRF